jgi:hypothetical protein
MKIRLLFLFVALATTTFAQAPNILWSRSYGGAAMDKGKDVQIAADGGFIFLGETASFGAGELDLYVVRTNSNGDTLWTRTYGGALDDEPSSLKATSDGGWIISASTESFGAGEDDFWLIKIDAIGNVLWQQTYGGPQVDYSTDVEQTADGGYVMTGYTAVSTFAFPDARLLRMNSTGAEIWSRTYGTPDDQEAFYDVIELADHGLMISGYNEDLVNGHGSWDAWVVKTDSMGMNLVGQYYGGFGWEMAHAIIPTSDGNFVFTGSTDLNFAIFTDFYVVKINSNLDTLWTRHWGRADVEEPFDIAPTQDGGFVMAGHTCTPGVGGCVKDAYIVKINSNGDSLWTQKIGDAQDDAAFAIKETCDGGFVVAGYETSPLTLNTELAAIRLSGDPALRIPLAPQQLTVRHVGADIRLRWPAVTAATSGCMQSTVEYRVYSDLLASGSYTTYEGASFDTTFVDTAAATRKFYRITGYVP